MWESNGARDDGIEDEDARPTWPSAPPDAAVSSTRLRETWEDCATLAERMVRLVGGDASGTIEVDVAIDRALAECTDVRRVLRRRAPFARVRIDAARWRELFVALVREVLAKTRDTGAYARALAIHTEIDERGSVVVEVADLRRVWATDAEAWLAADESNARATDAATGIVLSTTTHPAFGRLARIEIPPARR